MANYAGIKATIDANVKQNNNQAITGQILNSVLNDMVTSLAAGYIFKGVASPSTNPGSPDEKVFYVASPGTYPNFSNIVVPDSVTGFLKWDSSWHLETISTGVADGSVTLAKLASSLADLLFSTGYKYMGVASPSANPGEPGQNVFYLASPGTYVNYGAAVIPQGALGVLKYNGSWSADIINSVGQILEMGFVEEDGLFFVDGNMNIGAEIIQSGFYAINGLTFRELT